MASTPFLEKAYLAYFGRPMDTTAVIAYANASEAVVMTDFSSSPESKALYGASFGLPQINAIYNMLFGRDAELTGANNYLLSLQDGRETPASVAMAILNGAKNEDKTAVSNKLIASAAFTAALDTTAEAVGYSGDAAAASARAFLSTVTATAATATAITAAVVTVVGASTAVNTTNASLTVAQDNLLGTAGNDQFTANIVNNANTLQSGDKITGGAGVDRLNADVGNTQSFAITPETTGVEQVAIRTQANGTDSNNNNLSNPVQIDAERMVGVTQWESNNSRADLLIEDVRILSSQITKDITIAMVETDPGHVDMGVYFDQYSLRNVSTTSATLALEIMDTRSTAAGTAPLKDSPFNGFAFFYTASGETAAKLITVTSPAIDAAQTYAELLTAVSAAVKLLPELSTFSVSLTGTFSATDTLGAKQTGQTLVLTSTSGTIVSTGAGAGWLAAGAVPASSGFHTNMAPATKSNTDLVTSKVILDDVGRGSTSGDLVIGGLSTGATSSSNGVQRFEIEVRDNSKLESIQSTNNTLQEVTIKNGITSSSSFAYVNTVANSGNLTVNGNSGLNGAADADPVTGKNVVLPGTTAATGTHGFSDVRLIDASTMTGNLAFTAEVTKASIAKYMNLGDTQAAPAADTVNFAYTGGAGNDTMVVNIDAAVAASRSSIISGHEDFKFAIEGGAGNDTITVKMVNAANTGNAQNWYNNQDLNNNFTVSGGAGNDTIHTPGAGDMVIDGGAGDDTIYTDNTGAKAQWVFNTTDQLTTLATARNIDDLRSGTTESYNLFNTKLSVTFLGLPNTVVVNLANANFKVTDLEINQAIKMAINTDPVLSKLLLAQDGPAGTLMVKALVDGVMNVPLTAADLAITLVTPALGTLSAAEIAAAGLVYLAKDTVATDALVVAAIAAGATAFSTNPKGDYTAVLANQAGADLTGTLSTSTSDNVVTGGTGNDVIVLGTTEGTTAAASSNETVVFGPGFGNDTIVNFTATGFGADHLDFTGIFGLTIALPAVDKSIVIGQTFVATPSLSVQAQVEAVFSANNIKAQTHVYVAVNAQNVGTVYQITDAIGVDTASAAIVGTIDLADTSWSTLTAANFVDSVKVGFLAEGANAPATGTATAVAVTVSAINPTPAAFDAGTVNNTFNISAATSYTYNIANFGAGDKMAFPAGGAASVVNNSYTDGIVDVGYSVAGQTVTIHLTGLSNANDLLLNSGADFNTVFGAGTIA